MFKELLYKLNCELIEQEDYTPTNQYIHFCNAKTGKEYIQFCGKIFVEEGN